MKLTKKQRKKLIKYFRECFALPDRECMEDSDTKSWSLFLVYLTDPKALKKKTRAWCRRVLAVRGPEILKGC